MRGFELPGEGFPVSLFDQTVDLRGDQSLVLTQNLGVIVNSLTPGPAERIVEDQCMLPPVPKSYSYFVIKNGAIQPRTTEFYSICPCFITDVAPILGDHVTVDT